MAALRAVLIAGPTASGKSALAVALARALGGRVINADSQQVYGGWRVLTARPSAAEEAAAPHALYGHVGLAEAYSVGHWLRDGLRVLAGYRYQHYDDDAPTFESVASAVPPFDRSTHQHTLTLGVTLTSALIAGR